MGFKSIFSKAASLSLGTPFAGFFVSTGIDTLKALFPGQGDGRSSDGGYQAAEPDTASGSTINVIKKNQQIPAVIGTHRVTPAAVTPPFTDVFTGRIIDTYQIFALQGAHKFEDIEINGARLDSFEDDELEIQTREGFDSDTPITLIETSVFEDVFDEDLPDFQLTQGSSNLVRTQDPPTDSKPTWVVHASKTEPDEIWCDIDLTNGLIRQGSVISSTEFLVRIRLKGSSVWRNLPVFRLRGNFTERRRFRIKLVFTADPGGLNLPDWTTYTFPAITFNKLHDAFSNYQSSTWDSDPYFGTHETSGSVSPGDTLTQHLDASDAVATLYLDPNDPSNPWPKGEYEIAIRRGYGGRSMPTTNLNWYQEVEGTSGLWRLSDNGTRTLPENSDMVWHSISTVRNEHPISGDNYALLAVKARNLQLNSVTVKASGYTADLISGVWTEAQNTSNPAAWARRVRTDENQAYPMSDAVRADADFESWHADCVAQGLECNMVVDGGMTHERIFAVLCEAGYAVPRNGSTRGVFSDKDRSGEEIQGILTDHNSSEFSIQKSFGEIPHAFLVKWYDKDLNYAIQPERVRYRSGYSASTPGLRRQSLVAPGKVTAAEVDEWADRKLAELEARDASFRIRTDWENVQYDTGAILGLNIDIGSEDFGSGLIKEVIESGTDITGLVLHGKLPITRAMTGSPGEQIDIRMRYADGTIVRREIDERVDTNTITFTTPLPHPGANPAVWGIDNIWALGNVWTQLLRPGGLVWVGPLNAEERRVILTDIDRDENIGAILTMVDEAPSIHP